MLDEAPPLMCQICPRRLLDHEFGRQICTPCEHRVDQDLRKLPGPRGLYARLCLRIHPGRRGGDGLISGTRLHSIPPDEEILNLTSEGGIVADLETWVKDWAEYGLASPQYGGRLQYRVDKAVETLRFNLNRAASRHPALPDFSREIFQIRARAEAVITGERKERPIAVACPCGTVLHVTVSTPGARCRGCNTQYSRAEAFDLPLATRTAA